MAVLGRLLISSAERLDLPDVLSIDSYTAGDFKHLLKGFVGDSKPYVLKGFDVIDPQSAIGTQSVSIRVANSIVFYPGSQAGSFYHGLPEGNVNAQPLVPELRKNAVNYVYLTFSTMDTSVDTREFWDPDKDGGGGGEFSQDINTESVLVVEANVSTGAFPDNTIPIAIVTVGPVVVTAIEDARDMMFRLGSGGIAPNPLNRYEFSALPTSLYERVETPLTMTSPSDPNAFQGADKNIDNLKAWMDVVMTKLLELGGSQFWYEDTSTYNVINTFLDAMASAIKSKGQWEHDSSVAGLLTWTEDIIFKSTQDPRDYILRSGNLTLSNEQVAYLSLVRNQPINGTNQPVSWTNGQPYINTVGGSVGLFANLTQGDWIKKANDSNDKWLRVEQFYDTVNLGGSTTTAALAKSIRLSGNYQGTTQVYVAKYDKGVYQSSDPLVHDRSSVTIQSAGGDFRWIAFRSDTVENVSSIVATTLSGTITAATGTHATVTSTAHGLASGDRITVTAPMAQAGTYVVEKDDANTFTFPTSDTTTGAFTAFYAIVTTAARSTAYGLQLESANHRFEASDTVTIAGTTNFNGSYLVNPKTLTTFNVAIAATHATETVGTASLARIEVRSETGVAEIVQGEVINISDEFTENAMSYIGMPSVTQSYPTYATPSGYGTLNGQANYNGSASDNLTLRTSELTAMMADKAQDKTVKYLCNATVVTNTTNGAAQELTFSPVSSTLTILQPGSPGNAVVSLPNVSPGISLLANQSAYVSINRNASSTPSITVVNTTSVPVGENIIVIASRLSGAATYIWNGQEIVSSIPLVPSYPALVKVKYYDPLSNTLPTGNPVVEDGSNVQAGDLVLFSGLFSGNNQVYLANGSGTNISSWSLQYPWNGSATPSSADTVIVQEGAGFQDQVGKFNDTTWVFNDKVRYFNGVDYFEQDAIAATTLNDNTTNGTVFTVQYAGSEYMIIDFSVNRATTRETGTLHVTSDGTNVSISEGGSYLGTSGVSFSGIISGGNLILRYTTTSTGSTATMKFMVRRWSNATGGPGGVPSYSGAAGSATAAAPGSSIQFNNAGLLGGSSNFLIDTVNNAIVLNGLQQTTLSNGVTLVDNTAVPTTAFSYNAASYSFAVIEFSIVRNGAYSMGRLQIANDTIVTAQSDDYVETAATGITFSSTISGPNVLVKYVSTATGFNGTLKYSMRRWN